MQKLGKAMTFLNSNKFCSEITEAELTLPNEILDDGKVHRFSSSGRHGDEASQRPEVMLLNGASLTPEPIKWLWRFWLALGKLHILAGAPGQGKTTIALACAATVTTGGRWPDGTSCEVGNVLIWSGEDDPADTLLPRLLAAGADKARCYFVSGTRINGEVHSFDPARDMFALEEQAQRIGGIKLLIVDPVVSAVAGDSHKNTEVRRALQPLVDLANRLDTAVVGISHFSKGGAGGDPASRVVGSIAFTAVARVVLVAAKLKGEEGELDRRVLARGKSNIGPDDGGSSTTLSRVNRSPASMPAASCGVALWKGRLVNCWLSRRLTRVVLKENRCRPKPRSF